MADALQITDDNVRALSRYATPRIVRGIVDDQQAIYDGGINTPLRLCHFMAQLAHESANLTVTREFASGAAYEWRRDLGNVRQGDGVRYRGRGLIQTTGRANYREATGDIRAMIPDAPDFEADPVALESFPWALLAGISYWRRRSINVLADRDDVVGVTKRVNGGTNGLQQRMAYLARAKNIWLTDGVVNDSDPTIEVGSSGAAVRDLQTLLVRAGYAVMVDGDFGPITSEAVKAFQEHHELVNDGVVGPATWQALRA